MNEERWERTKQILESALQLAPDRRSQYLSAACGADHELRAEVESLIASHEEAGSRFLAVAAPEILDLGVGEPAIEPQHVIGNYTLLRQIGQGGMGQVWLAEQTVPVRRQVALKLLNIGLYDNEVLKRFQLERQSLAIMDHPSIAKVFDAGATVHGQPYFVMEYVPGLPITNYCDSKRLKIRERLEIFTMICEGVQHAHQKAIIHRDLKPANILVQEIDGRPLPRIIDFGLAKAITSQAAGESLYTHAGSFVGTPGYMSPEQCDPNAPDIDIRTDVYSLGVVLYVLLAGSQPFDAGIGKKQTVDELVQRVRHEDPPRPSNRISIGDKISTASDRDTEPKQLIGLLRGDLDWITMKALEKERNRRYGTASELAADIGRYLHDEPVLARPASLRYRTGKYVRRHRVGVAAAGIVLVLLGVFGVMQSVQLRKTIRERDRADRIAEFMTGIFKVSDPRERLGNTVSAREILDKASGEIESGLARDSELQAQMMYVMGRAYLNLGIFSRAQSLFERAIKVSGPGGQEKRGTMKAEHDLAWALLQEGHFPEAENLERQLLAKQQRVLGADDRDTWATMGELAFTLCQTNQCGEGIKLNRDVLEKQKKTLGPEAYDTLSTMDNLAIMLSENGQSAEAEKLGQQSVEIHLRVFGLEDLGTINALLGLGEVQRDLRHDEDAQKTLRRVLEVEGRILGPDQPETAVTRYDLATVLIRNGQVDEGLSLLRQAIDHGLPGRMDADVEKDPLLNPLHSDRRFAALAAHAQERAAASASN